MDEAAYKARIAELEQLLAAKQTHVVGLTAENARLRNDCQLADMNFRRVSAENDRLKAELAGPRAKVPA